MLGDSDLFYQSLLLFSENTMEMLTKATAGVVGVGGVGSIAAELVARQGIGHMRIADPDIYQPYNLNRQIFATCDSLGRKKALVAAERLRSINSQLNVVPFDHGLTPSNAMEFCIGCDALIAQPDKESAKIVLHRIAKQHGIPVICGSRSSIHEHRWKVRARVWNYRDEPNTPCYDETYHPKMASLSWEELTPERLSQYDNEFIENRDQVIFRKVAEEHPEYYGSIDGAKLLDRIDHGPNFQNRHVCAVIANTGGCLAAAATLRILLRGPSSPLEINLWEGDGTS